MARHKGNKAQKKGGSKQKRDKLGKSQPPPTVNGVASPASSSSPLAAFPMNYIGADFFREPESFPKDPTTGRLSLERIRVCDMRGEEAGAISNEEFFDAYVAKRKPVVIEGPIRRQDLSSWKDPEYLKEVAGKSRIQVEVRDETRNTKFGDGYKKWMNFADVIDAMVAGSESYYVTTQRIPLGESGPISLCGPPLIGNRLIIEFPTVHRFLPLAPYQFNVWMGRSQTGSTTGLHHDFHDNLYTVVRGRKVFRIFPPSSVVDLPTVGSPRVVHPNGLICYEDDTLEDGSNPLSVARWRYAEAQREVELLGQRVTRSRMLKVKDEVVRRLDADEIGALDSDQKAAFIEQALMGKYDDEGVEQMKAYLAEAEAKAEKALSELLILEIPQVAVGENSEDSGTEEEEQNDDVDENSPESDRIRRLCAIAIGSPTDVEEVEDFLEQPDDAFDLTVPTEEQDKGRYSEMYPVGTTPPHFCKNNTTDDRSGGVLGRYLEVELNEGDMLYLPASWFHEVFSYSSADDPYHLALNAWYHPPNSDCSLDTPYTSVYWKSQTKSLEEMLDMQRNHLVMKDVKLQEGYARARRVYMAYDTIQRIRFRKRPVNFRSLQLASEIKRLLMQGLAAYTSPPPPPPSQEDQ